MPEAYGHGCRSWTWKNRDRRVGTSRGPDSYLLVGETNLIFIFFGVFQPFTEELLSLSLSSSTSSSPHLKNESHCSNERGGKTLAQFFKGVWVRWVTETGALRGGELRRRTGDKESGSLDPGRSLSAGGRELLVLWHEVCLPFPPQPSPLQVQGCCPSCCLLGVFFTLVVLSHPHQPSFRKQRIPSPPTKSFCSLHC